MYLCTLVDGCPFLLVLFASFGFPVYVVAFVTMYVRYKLIQAFNNYDRGLKILNILSIVVGIFSCIGVSLVANFQVIIIITASPLQQMPEFSNHEFVFSQNTYPRVITQNTSVKPARIFYVEFLNCHISKLFMVIDFKTILLRQISITVGSNR